jgi:hypothetical protein
MLTNSIFDAKSGRDNQEYWRDKERGGAPFAVLCPVF